MFTGIVTAVGRIERVTPIDGSADAGVRLSIEASALDLSDVAIGDSIAVQGACLTVIDKSAAHFEVEVSRESLSKTAGLTRICDVNLEKALRPNDRLGGHLVSGHVDGLGRVTHFAPVGESHALRILVPTAMAKFFAYKGSVTVNGVSLTVNSIVDRADDCELSINLIAHTIAVTTLRELQPGAVVNIEVDLIARYVERMLTLDAPSRGVPKA